MLEIGSHSSARVLCDNSAIHGRCWFRFLLPILYSFRRCPYAIRARMALYSASIPVELREVVLRDKQPELLAASAKGTVPVLVLDSGKTIDQSIDVMQWALAQSDPNNWLKNSESAQTWIIENDGDFKHWLDRYKYADRYPEQTEADYRQQAERFLARIEAQLQSSDWLGGAGPGLADVAVFPFVRQFAGVNPAWFEQAPYSKLRSWLSHWLSSEVFTGSMIKRPQWHAGDAPTLFPVE